MTGRINRLKGSVAETEFSTAHIPKDLDAYCAWLNNQRLTRMADWHWHIVERVVEGDKIRTLERTEAISVKQRYAAEKAREARDRAA